MKSINSFQFILKGLVSYIQKYALLLSIALIFILSLSSSAMRNLDTPIR